MRFLYKRMNNQQEDQKKGKGIPARYSRFDYIELSMKEGRNRIYSGMKKASMTIETALVLPLFLFAILSVMQFASLQIASSALLAGMQETAKEMAVYAYVQDLGIGTGDSLAGDIIGGGLSAIYAKGKIEELAGNAASGGTLHLLQSSFLVNDVIDIAGSYQRDHTFSVFPVKKVKAVLRARVRAWTGREGRSRKTSEEHGTGEASSDGDTVYVAKTGTVYHKDPNCTHIKLSISCVDKASVGKRRNSHGEKYHACEHCGANAGDEVYITSQGNRYHSSLECSGLKRNVRECKLSEVEGMRPCSRCGG